MEKTQRTPRFTVAAIRGALKENLHKEFRRDPGRGVKEGA